MSYEPKPEWLKVGELVQLNEQGLKYRKHSNVTPRAGVVVSERIPHAPPAGHITHYDIADKPECWVQFRLIQWTNGQQWEAREDEIEFFSEDTWQGLGL